MKDLLLISFLLQFAGCASHRTSDVVSTPIDRAIKARSKQFKECFDHEAHLADTVKFGRVTVAWVIEPDGSARNVEVAETTLNVNAVERCLVDEVKQIRFPAEQTANTIRYPFTFYQPEDQLN